MRCDTRVYRNFSLAKTTRTQAKHVVCALTAGRMPHTSHHRKPTRGTHGSGAIRASERHAAHTPASRDACAHKPCPHAHSSGISRRRLRERPHKPLAFDFADHGVTRTLRISTTVIHDEGCAFRIDMLKGTHHSGVVGVRHRQPLHAPHSQQCIWPSAASARCGLPHTKQTLSSFSIFSSPVLWCSSRARR